MLQDSAGGDQNCLDLFSAMEDTRKYLMECNLTRSDIDALKQVVINTMNDPTSELDFEDGVALLSVLNDRNDKEN